MFDKEYIVKTFEEGIEFSNKSIEVFKNEKSLYTASTRIFQERGLDFLYLDSIRIIASDISKANADIMKRSDIVINDCYFYPFNIYSSAYNDVFSEINIKPISFFDIKSIKLMRAISTKCFYLQVIFYFKS